MIVLEIKKFIIHGNCCQCGLICPNNFCGKLSEVLFNIYTANNRSAPCGTIKKKAQLEMNYLQVLKVIKLFFRIKQTQNIKLF